MRRMGRIEEMYPRRINKEVAIEDSLKITSFGIKDMQKNVLSRKRWLLKFGKCLDV